ncbi:alkene reductase [Methylobacterium sp. E-066]|uniref:alkene reductase n=1 Tax=Methylobacterium sp. E-066 TaxID=2836584 RepID=UPI001FBA5707|nr:alkene reductase [Methylobacterium sp. E-066]MCJ2138654.1 alkene reductase [Methylobacterium sp. E-066]
MSPLFAPFSLAGLQLPNRIVMAPLTRSRAANDAADAMTALYYTQRASAGLIVSEGTTISQEGRGYLFNPGIFSPRQVAGWRTVTDSVHGAGGHMFAQLWHVGRVSHTSLQKDQAPPVSASGRTAAGAKAYAYDDAGKPAFVAASRPRALSTDAVGRVVQDFATAASNAVEARFDGVEIHGANGYLHEQFLNPHVNDRTDRYTGATVAGRLAFTLEVVDAIAARIGAARIGIRISPYGRLFDMPAYDETEATYLALATELAGRGIAYIHVMDQSGFDTGAMAVDAIPAQHLFWDKLRKAFPTGAIILAGGMTLDRANTLVGAGTIDLAAFGQAFIANPDLVARLREGFPLAVPDKATFYGGGAAGYVDYPSYRAA